MSYFGHVRIAALATMAAVTVVVLGALAGRAPQPHSIASPIKTVSVPPVSVVQIPAIQPIERVTEQMGNLETEVKKIRWTLIQKRFRNLNAVAAKAGWKEGAPPAVDRQRYEEWSFILHQAEMLRKGGRPKRAPETKYKPTWMVAE